MFVRLFVCLVFLTKIVASDCQTTLKYGTSSKYVNDNQINTRKLVTDSLNDSPGSAAQSTKITQNKTNGSNSITVVPLTKEQDKNGTATKKPETDKEGMETQSSQMVISYPPYATYEVTENVVDIPDDRTPVGPIVTNYTHRPPILNLAKPKNKTATDKVTESKIKTKKNRLNILHINAEFDDKEHKVHENKVDGLFKGIKDYIHSFQRGIVKGFHSLFHKYQDVDHDHSLFHKHQDVDLNDHGERFERAVDREGHGVSNGVQNVHETKYNVHRRYIRKT